MLNHTQLSGAQQHMPIGACRNWLTAPAAEHNKVKPICVSSHVLSLVAHWTYQLACALRKAELAAMMMQGPPLRCKWCPGTLLLNATALKNHLESKRHVKRQKVSKDEPSPICLAEDVLDDESVSST